MNEIKDAFYEGYRRGIFDTPVLLENERDLKFDDLIARVNLLAARKEEYLRHVDRQWELYCEHLHP